MRKRTYTRWFGGYPQEYHTHILDVDNIMLSMVGMFILGIVVNVLLDFMLGNSFSGLSTLRQCPCRR